MDTLMETNQDNIITLTSLFGERHFLLLDLIEYNGESYVILQATDEETEGPVEVEILKLEIQNEKTETYIEVFEQDILDAVFELFKKKWEGYINFVN